MEDIIVPIFTYKETEAQKDLLNCLRIWNSKLVELTLELTSSEP